MELVYAVKCHRGKTHGTMGHRAPRTHFGLQRFLRLRFEQYPKGKRIAGRTFFPPTRPPPPPLLSVRVGWWGKNAQSLYHCPNLATIILRSACFFSRWFSSSSWSTNSDQVPPSKIHFPSVTLYCNASQFLSVPF